MKKEKTLGSNYVDLGSGIPVYGYKSKSIRLRDDMDFSLKLHDKKSKPDYVHFGSGRKRYGL